MNRLLAVVMTMLIIQFCYAKETYYYKQTKVIKNSKTIKQGTGGQFISFLGGVCYECDKKGNGIGHGTLKYEKSKSGSLKVYVGGSYWGNATEFRFSKDLSKLNVCLDDGTVYVYTRSTPPAKQTTSSLIRKNKSSGGREYIPIITPVPNNVSSGGSYTPSKPSNNQRESSSKPSKRWRNVRKTERCPLCEVPGKCNTCNGKGWYYNNYRETDCPNCDGYKTGRCRKCHGTGTLEKIEQVYE